VDELRLTVQAVTTDEDQKIVVGLQVLSGQSLIVCWENPVAIRAGN
jgi:hypothetical protein